MFPVNNTHYILFNDRKIESNNIIENMSINSVSIFMDIMPARFKKNKNVICFIEYCFLVLYI